jgi:Squalene-hopene cyclase C-terminal domain/Prenyltransferase and squalene oxidase repeat
VCAAAGFGYGALLDFYQWTLGATHTLAAYAAVAGTSFPYNLAHAVGNFVFALAIGPAFVRALRRYRRRFEVRWVAPAAAAALLAALVVPIVGSSPPARAATSAKSKALKYIQRAQNPDGGFGGAPGQSSSSLYTGWVTLGIAAAGENPRDVRRGKSTPISYTRKHVPSATDVGELERTILALRAAGVSPRNFGRQDLVAQLTALRKSDGSWDHLVDHTAFGILALRAGGASPSSLRSSALWLERQQNSDGGFGFGQKGGASDSDDTGSSIQALVAVGRGKKRAVRKAVAYLRHAQKPDGGFGQLKTDSSNAQSTSWAVQGLAAAHVNPNSLRRNGHTPISYITSLQQANGAVRYSRTSAQTPVWVTGQALTALARKPFPIKAPKRRAPVVPAKTATTPKPKPKTHKAKIVPIAHAAKKKKHAKLQSHGQTIAAPKIKPAATRQLPPAALTRSVKRTRRHPFLGITLGALALAALLSGGYLTRKRLRRRPA